MTKTVKIIIISSSNQKNKVIKKIDKDHTDPSIQDRRTVQTDNGSVRSDQNVKIQNSILSILQDQVDPVQSTFRAVSHHQRGQNSLNGIKAGSVRSKQLKLTDWGFKATVTQWHTICAQCGRKLSYQKSVKNGRGNACNAKHRRRSIK